MYGFDNLHQRVRPRESYAAPTADTLWAGAFGVLEHFCIGHVGDVRPQQNRAEGSANPREISLLRGAHTPGGGPHKAESFMYICDLRSPFMRAVFV